MSAYVGLERNIQIPMFHEMSILQGLIQLWVRILVEGIQIHSQGSREQNGILWNDWDLGTKTREVHVEHIDFVNKEHPLTRFSEAEEGRNERTLPSSRSSNYSNLNANARNTMQVTRVNSMVKRNHILKLSAGFTFSPGLMTTDNNWRTGSLFPYLRDK